jgi:hypothetical protein
LMDSDAFIHEGFNVMKTLGRSTPDGRDQTHGAGKACIISVCQEA